MESLNFFVIEENITAQSTWRAKENLLIDLAKNQQRIRRLCTNCLHDLKSPLRSMNSLISWIKEENEGGFRANNEIFF
jgi:light-regulated signal transduction histidine kinase (bacteriophytochrome)